MTTIRRSMGIIALFVFVLLPLTACGEGIDVVDAGTYSATVEEAVADEQEIYVALDDGRHLELYFSEDTELLQGGEPVEFSVLGAGSSVQVTVEREGNRNVPTRVEIISP
ncbi:MAG: hypothetical protein WD627_03690 [Actinomycetota bacterium]